MRQRKTRFLAAALLVATLAIVAAAVACGGEGATDETAGAPAGTAMERAKAILGHEPTGLAKTIVDRGVIVVANDSNYPPQSFIDKETKEIVGFDADVAKAAAEILGVNIKWAHPQWAAVVPGLQTGRWDVSIGSMPSAIDGERTDPALAQRWKTVSFTKPYYYTSGQIFVKKGGVMITGVADLDGQEVGVGAATTFYNWLKMKTKAVVVQYETPTDPFGDLRDGRIGFAMAAGTTGQEAILEGMPIEFSGKPLYYEDASMAVKKGETDLVALLDYAVRQMHESGSLTRMSRQWYNGIDLTVKE